MDTCYFAGEIIGGWEDVCYPEGRNPHEGKMAIHSDKTLRDNTRTVMGQLEQPWFKGMEHSRYSPCLVPCDFFFLVT
jgi:hypothetical protein